MPAAPPAAAPTGGGAGTRFEVRALRVEGVSRYAPADLLGTANFRPSPMTLPEVRAMAAQQAVQQTVQQVAQRADHCRRRSRPAGPTAAV